MNMNLKKLSNAGSIGLLSVAAAVGGLSLSQAGASPARVRVPAATADSVVAVPCDAETPTSVSVEVSEVVAIDGRDAPVFKVAVDTKSEEKLKTKTSFAVYDLTNEAVIPPERSPIEALAGTSRGERRFEVPTGLPDGQYYAEGMVAHAREGEQKSSISADRAYFELVEGRYFPLTAEEFVAYQINDPRMASPGVMP